jgi:hypothetical protein
MLNKHVVLKFKEKIVFLINNFVNFSVTYKVSKDFKLLTYS